MLWKWCWGGGVTSRPSGTGQSAIVSIDNLLEQSIACIIQFWHPACDHFIKHEENRRRIIGLFFKQRRRRPSSLTRWPRLRNSLPAEAENGKVPFLLTFLPRLFLLLLLLFLLLVLSLFLFHLVLFLLTSAAEKFRYDYYPPTDNEVVPGKWSAGPGSPP